MTDEMDFIPMRMTKTDREFVDFVAFLRRSVLRAPLAALTVPSIVEDPDLPPNVVRFVHPSSGRVDTFEITGEGSLVRLPRLVEKKES
jgi:hypothetical protein